MKSRLIRKSPRRKQYDYGSSWCYFVTICTQDRIHCFGEIVGAGLALTDIGKICDQEIQRMMSLRHDLEMREYIIMPNHIHLLFSFGSLMVEASHNPTKEYSNQTLSSIVWSLKSAVIRECNKQWLENWLWSFTRQRSFHDHIVRNQQEFDRIKYYIQTNPQSRESDTFNK